MNLPRTVRKNVVLIPAPSHDINTLLGPLVDELINLWEGVTMEISSVVVRCALLCCACDLPVGRKVCGFLSHSASLGCSKSCKGTVGNMEYKRRSWPIRTSSAECATGPAVMHKNRAVSEKSSVRLPVFCTSYTLIL